MTPTRSELRLIEVQEKIARLSIVSRDEFNLPARYSALVKLEAILSEQVAARPTDPRRPDRG